ncbi:MAG: HIT domain-containing protein [Waddliaceae bacterium]
MKTLFKQMIDGEVPCDQVFENDNILAIKDKYPEAPVHILIIPKKEFKDLQSVPEEELSIIGEVVAVAQKLAKEFKIESGYRLITNVGPSAGQSIFHLHFHLIGGHSLGKIG